MEDPSQENPLMENPQQEDPSQENPSQENPSQENPSAAMNVLNTEGEGVAARHRVVRKVLGHLSHVQPGDDRPEWGATALPVPHRGEIVPRLRVSMVRPVATMVNAITDRLPRPYPPQRRPRLLRPLANQMA
jgi:hypothetical protein